jgi:hypothetical protein
VASRRKYDELGNAITTKGTKGTKENFQMIFLVPFVPLVVRDFDFSITIGDLTRYQDQSQVDRVKSRDAKNSSGRIFLATRLPRP